MRTRVVCHRLRQLSSLLSMSMGLDTDGMFVKNCLVTHFQYDKILSFFFPLFCIRFPPPPISLFFFSFPSLTISAPNWWRSKLRRGFVDLKSKETSQVYILSYYINIDSEDNRIHVNICIFHISKSCQIK